MIRTEAVPTVDYPLTIHGEGVLEWQGKQVPVVSAIAERLKYRPDRPWTVTLRLGKTTSADLTAVLYGKDPLPSFRGHASPDQAFVIPAFEYRSRTAGRVDGEAYEISLGLSDAPCTPSEVVLTAYLSDNSVALSLRDFFLEQHDETVRGGKKRAPQSVRSRLGTIKLWRGSSREPVEIGGVEASARRSATIAQVVVPPKKREPGLLSMVDQLAEELDHLTPILSLCSRQRVGCYRIAVWAHWKEGNGGLIEGEIWRHAPGPDDRRSADPLINPLKISPSGLDKVVRAYRQHPAREQLYRAITYTVGAHNQRIIEHHALFSFTAIESLVDTLHGRPYSLDEHEFSQLTKTLRSAIKGAKGEAPLTKNQRRDLYAKFGELRRRPMIPRIMELIDSKDVKWSDLWPNLSLEIALRRAYELRNQLIHQGHLSDPGQTIRDSMRITALAERVLMAELEMPQEWISHLAYYVFATLEAD